MTKKMQPMLDTWMIEICESWICEMDARFQKELAQRVEIADSKNIAEARDLVKKTLHELKGDTSGRDSLDDVIEGRDYSEEAEEAEEGEKAEKGAEAEAEEEPEGPIAAQTGWIGSRTAQPDIATPTGIRQTYLIHSKPKHLSWGRQAVKDLAYIVMDREPLRH